MQRERQQPWVTPWDMSDISDTWSPLLSNKLRTVSKRPTQFPTWWMRALSLKGLHCSIVVICGSKISDNQEVLSLTILTQYFHLWLVFGFIQCSGCFHLVIRHWNMLRSPLDWLEYLFYVSHLKAVITGSRRYFTYRCKNVWMLECMCIDMQVKIMCESRKSWTYLMSRLIFQRQRHRGLPLPASNLCYSCSCQAYMGIV